MTRQQFLSLFARGRTDLIFELLNLPDWREALAEGAAKALSWFIYSNNLTAIGAVLAAGGDLSTMDLDAERADTGVLRTLVDR